MNIFEAIASGDVKNVIALLDPVAKRATRKASERAHAKGLDVADGRADEERLPRKIREAA